MRCCFVHHLVDLSRHKLQFKPVAVLDGLREMPPRRGNQFRRQFQRLQKFRSRRDEPGVCFLVSVCGNGDNLLVVVAYHVTIEG